MTALVALIMAHSILSGILWLTPQPSLSIAPSQIRPEVGKAFYTVVGFNVSAAYWLPRDSSQTPTASNLVLFEDGQALGPPHSLHLDIRQNGAGRFSHWDDGIIFSTTDGTDPRNNGRTYSIRASTELRPALKLPLLAILVLADAAFLFLYRKKLGFLLEKWGARVLAACAALLILLAALSTAGLFGTIIAAKSGPPKDVSLVLQILQHALLGCITSIGIWAAGAGVVRLILRSTRNSFAEILVPAFPLSIVLLAGLVAVALTVPWGRSIALALWLACLVPLSTWHPPRGQVMAALKATLAVIPLALAFGIWLALLWHGPTNALAGSPSGDLTFYAGSIWSLASQPYPYLDLGYANGQAYGYFNSLYPAFGATLLYLPNFDPFLFLLASGGVSYVFLSALMLHLCASDPIFRSIGLFDVLLLTLSVVVAARYPYWIAESTPMVFIPALTMSTWWMAERGWTRFPWSLVAMLAGLTGSLLSKVVTAVVLVPLGSIGIWSRFQNLPQTARLAIFTFAAVFAIYCLLMLFYFMPVYIAYANLGPESYRTPHWYFLSRDIGAVLMVATAWMVADLSVALVLSIGIVSFLAFSWLFYANFVCVSILLGLLLVQSRTSSNIIRVLAFVAFALSLPALILGDQASASSGVIWIACLGGAAFAAILIASDMTTANTRITDWAPASIAVTTLAMIALGLTGVARGSIIVDSGWHLTQGTQLTPAVKEVWTAVRELTPKNSLIFTDQVDETENLLGGWNTYAYSGQRQVYLSSYYTSAELRTDKQKVEQLLATNKAVLEGSRSPQNVPTKHSYDSFYSVVSVTKAAPANWRQIFKNSQYALYEIVSR